MEHKYYKQLDETIYTKKLENGLTVCVLPRKEMAKTFGIFTTKYGSIDQHFVPINQQEAVKVPDGVAHFLEHKLFEKEDRDVFHDFSKQGASANAFTSFTKTAYLFSATSNIDENIKTLLDFVQEPYFSDESVEKEKGIIAQEINMYDDQPDWCAFFGTIKNMFEKHPVHIDIAGTVDSINKITKEDLYTCYESFYHPSNMVLFIAGNIEPENILELVENNQKGKTFEPSQPIERFYPEEPKAVANKKTILNMPVSIPKAFVGIKEADIPKNGEEFIKREWLLDLALDFLFSKSGVIYEEMYEKNLIDQSFSYESYLEENFGFTIISSNTKNPLEFTEVLNNHLVNLDKLSIDENTFKRIKQKKIGQFIRSLNSLELIANQYSHYQMMDLDFFESLATLESLSFEEYKQFIRSWVSEEQLTQLIVEKEA